MSLLCELHYRHNCLQSIRGGAAAAAIAGHAAVGLGECVIAARNRGRAVEVAKREAQWHRLACDQVEDDRRGLITAFQRALVPPEVLRKYVRQLVVAVFPKRFDGASRLLYTNACPAPCVALRERGACRS